MKNRKGIITFFVLLAVAFSCKDEFLDTKPYGALGEASLTETESGADALLIAAYSNLDGFSGWDNGTPWGGAASNWTFGSVAGGDAYKGSEANDQPDVTPLELHTVNANNPYLEGKWRNYYDGISRANKAIATFTNLPAGAISDKRRSIRLAEAKFLRAFYHLELRKVFGKVPYITEDLTDVRVGNDTDPIAKIQADLQFTIDNMENQPEPGRVKKEAAQVVMAYTYMWQKDYAKAKTLLDAVITSGKYSLNANYHYNFNAAYRNTSESVLEVQQAVNVGNDDNANNGDVLNFPYNGGPGGCCGFHQPSQNLVNAFRTDASGLPYLDTYNSTDFKSDDGVASFSLPSDGGHSVGELISDNYAPDTVTTVDPRLDWTVGRRGVPYLDWGLHPGKPWIRDQLYGGPYAPLKNVYYKSQEGTFTTASGWTKGYNSNNTKLIRYSDVLLLAAEAEIEVGTLSKALEYVNMVRDRAANAVVKGRFKGKWRVTDVDSDGKISATEPVIDLNKPAANYLVKPYAGFPDKAFATKAVRHERRIELGMEGHRFFDIVRWGVADTEKAAYFLKEKTKRTYLVNGNFVKGKSEVFPIPQKAITQSAKGGTPTIKQNTGY